MILDDCERKYYSIIRKIIPSDISYQIHTNVNLNIFDTHADAIL